MYGGLLLFDADFIHVVSITFTALIFTELITIGMTIHTWHWTMIVAEAFSVGVYIASLYLMYNWFGECPAAPHPLTCSSCPLLFCADTAYVMTVSFLWRTLAITAVSCVPLYVVKCLRRRIAPPAYAKVN
jgi:phospholipid-translocating ATPase